MSHSKAPWVAKKLSGSYAEPGWVVLFSDARKPGVHMRRIDFQGQVTEDDARLIAAAPDLLAVLKELEESASYWSEYDVPLGIVERIRAALAKAEAV